MTTKRKDGCVRTADVIAMLGDKFVLVERLKFPKGLALPGGHVDPGEQPREAAIREFKEETGLTLSDARFVTARRGARRDPRYSMSATRVYAGTATGTVRNEAGFTRVVLFKKRELCTLPKERFAFDHFGIVQRFLKKM